MQIADPLPAPVAATTVLGPSLALDLDWCLHAADSVYLRAAHPAIDRLYAEHPGLDERVRTFWSDGPPSFPELEVVATWAGALEVRDLEALCAALTEGIATIPLDLDLPSETAEVRQVILSRIDELRRSAGRRSGYFDLLAEVWGPVAEWWEHEGVAAVEHRAAEVRAELSRGSDWHRIVTTECETFVAQLPELVTRHQDGDPVILAPCALFGRGLYLDVAGIILVGFGVARADEAARARTSRVVRRLRALADPTRLAIFDFLKSGPSSVSEISNTFSLSQPTVSVHVKHLREAGLVSSRRVGARLEVSVDRQASANLATEVTTLLSS